MSAPNFIDVIQNTEEWLDLRMGKATASNFGVIMANDGKAFGDPARRYALKLALEKVTGKRSEGGFSNAHTERGHEQEPLARMLYEETYYVEIQNGGFFDCGEYGTSPDGLINNDGLIEIKSVIASTHYETMKRARIDPSYKWQIAGHLDCTGRYYVDFVSYCSEFPVDKQLLVYRVTRDELKDELLRLNDRRFEFIQLVKDIVSDISY